MSDKLGFAIIGLGHRAERHAGAISRLKNGYLCAAYSRSMKKAEEFSSRHRCQNIYDEFEYLLDDYKVDVVVISSPNALHLDQAKKAIASGRSIIVECPIEIEPTRVLELLDRADEEGVFVSSPIEMAFSDEFLDFRQRLQNLSIGSVQKVEVNMSLKQPSYGVSTKWRVDPELYGKSKIVAEGFQTIFLLVSLFGSPRDIECSGTLKGTLENGAELTVEINSDKEDAIRIYSESGTFDLPCSREKSSEILLDRFYSNYISSMETGTVMCINRANLCRAIELAQKISVLL